MLAENFLMAEVGSGQKMMEVPGTTGGGSGASLLPRGLEKTHICSIVRMGNTRMAPTSGQRDVPSSEL